MATNRLPVLQQVPRLLTGLSPAVADTSMTAPASTTSLGAGAASGSRIREISGILVATTATAGLIRFFLKTGGVFTLFDELLFGAAFTITQTTLVPRFAKSYPDLVLPSASTTIEITASNAAMQAAVAVIAEVWDYTPQ